MNNDTEQYRAGFEAWMRKEYRSGADQMLHRHSDGSYDEGDTDAKWEAWVAAKCEASTEPESVPIPKTVNMARMMVGMGCNYLQHHAPEQLAKREASTEPSAIRDAALEEAAKEAESNSLGRSDNEGDAGYSAACDDIASAIRALKGAADN